MTELPTQLKEADVAVIGLGLMGGSIALGLMNKCKSIMGVDLDESVVEQARQMGAFSRVSCSLSEILPFSNVILLAAPVRAIISIIREIPELHSGKAIVMDLGSTKSDIVSALEKMPDVFDPIGGHPMCGKEKASLMYADPAIFKNAPFALTPTPRTTQTAHCMALDIINTLGAYPVWLDAKIHDEWTAATSHLPYLVANALSYVTPLEAGALVGTGFRSTTRLATSDIHMIIDILKTNRENVARSLEELQGVLAQIQEHLIENDVEALVSMLNQGADKSNKLLNSDNSGEGKCD